MSTKFNVLVEDATKNHKRVDSLKDDKGNDIKISLRTPGLTTLVKGEIFRFSDVRVGGNLYQNTDIKSDNPVYYTVVELLDSNLAPTGEGKNLYLSSLSKTVYGFEADEEGNPVQIPGSYIVTEGDFAKAAQQNRQDILAFLATIGTRPIKVSNMKTLKTKNAFPKNENSPKLIVGYVFDFDYAN